MSILGLSITDTSPVIEGAGFWIRALARGLEVAYGYVLGLVSGVLGAIVLLILQSLSIIDPGWQTGISQGKLPLVNQSWGRDRGMATESRISAVKVRPCSLTF